MNKFILYYYYLPLIKAKLKIDTNKIIINISLKIPNQEKNKVMTSLN